MKVLWFATTNKNKIKEYEKLLPNVQIKSLLDYDKNLDIPEDEPTFEGNALFKARYLANIFKQPVLADDSGLCIKNLNNFPGIYSARWARPETDWRKINEKLLKKLEENKLNTLEKREAFFQCCIAFVDPVKNVEKIFTGICEGYIAFEQGGDNGFAYDKLFIPKGYDKTFGYLEDSLKQEISHRSKAVKQMVEFIEGY